MLNVKVSKIQVGDIVMSKLEAYPLLQVGWVLDLRYVMIGSSCYNVMVRGSYTNKGWREELLNIKWLEKVC